MRIWHEKLIPYLCQKHLCAMWRDGLGLYSVITKNKVGYRNHPATKEFAESPIVLNDVLSLVRSEMIRRGYNPKPLPPIYITEFIKLFGVTEAYDQEVIQRNKNQWQTLEEQIEILKIKECQCQLENLQ